jgi:hypothetical protein
MKTIKINFRHLRNEAHFRFFSAFIALFVEFPFVGEKVSALLERLRVLFAREDDVVDLIRKSDYTAKIAAADQRLDKAVVGFGDTIRGAIRHFNDNVADAAISLNNLLRGFGTIISKTYNEEIAAVTNLLQELETPKYASSVALISGLDGWITEIRAACNECITLLDARTSETANRPNERMVNIRREIEPVYFDVIARIEALILVEGETEYSDFVNKLNALIDEFNKLRPGKRSGKKTDDEKIEE